MSGTMHGVRIGVQGSPWHAHVAAGGGAVETHRTRECDHVVRAQCCLRLEGNHCQPQHNMQQRGGIAHHMSPSSAAA
eukprot:352965-Chlamydomonas_euryale.AAC.16